ncbi:MAG: biotin/lipoyl-containing protein, partial [Albidovulum sp.]
MMTKIHVPTLGESITEATVATWFKKPGDAVAVDEMLCELETDKVTVEVPSPVAGRMGEIHAAEGASVAVGAVLAEIAAAGDAPAATPAATPANADPVRAGASGAADKSSPKGANAASEANEGKMTDVMVPTLGESVTEATVASWFKKVGDAVAVDEMLCELETDKVSVEVPSPVAGVLTEIIAAEGATVDAKARLAIVSEGATATAKPADAAPAAASASAKDVEDAPAAKKAMAEAGVSRDQVQATGRDGRVMKDDVARAVAGSAAAAPAVASAVPAPAAAPRAPVAAQDAAREERVKMTRLRATIARRLKDAQNTAAMLTTYNEVDMSAVMALRNAYKVDFEKKHGVKLGFMSFFVKACNHALKE